MPEPAGQAWRTEAGTQLFYGAAEAEFIAPERSNLSGSPQEAADLVRGHLCRAKERTQFNADIAARFRGSGGSLSPFSDRFELEADDMGHEMTPVSVFFSAQIPIADFLRPLCQQLQFVPKSSGFGELPNKHFHGPAACENFGVWPHPNCLPFVRSPKNKAKHY